MEFYTLTLPALEVVMIAGEVTEIGIQDHRSEIISKLRENFILHVDIKVLA
jgi:hypothetical protein